MINSTKQSDHGNNLKNIFTLFFFCGCMSSVPIEGARSPCRHYYFFALCILGRALSRQPYCSIVLTEGERGYEGDSRNQSAIGKELAVICMYLCVVNILGACFSFADYQNQLRCVVERTGKSDGAWQAVSIWKQLIIQGTALLKCFNYTF